MQRFDCAFSGSALTLSSEGSGSCVAPGQCEREPEQLSVLLAWSQHRGGQPQVAVLFSCCDAGSITSRCKRASQHSLPSCRVNLPQFCQSGAKCFKGCLVLPWSASREGLVAAAA